MTDTPSSPSAPPLPPPLPFVDFSRGISDRLLYGYAPGDWKISTLIGGAPDAVSVRPFATNTTVGATFNYESSKEPFGLTVYASNRQKLPILTSVRYRRGKHSIDASPQNGVATYELVDEALRLSVCTNVLDGFSSFATFSTRLCRNALAGFAVDYDPSRSGLKDFTIGAKVNDIAVPKFPARFFDAAIHYNATNGLAGYFSTPIREGVTAVAKIERGSTLIGAEVKCPVSTKEVRAHYNVSRNVVGLSTSRMFEAWRATFSAAWSVEQRGKPTWGLAFSRGD